MNKLFANIFLLFYGFMVISSASASYLEIKDPVEAQGPAILEHLHDKSLRAVAWGTQNCFYAFSTLTPSSSEVSEKFSQTFSQAKDSILKLHTLQAAIQAETEKLVMYRCVEKFNKYTAAQENSSCNFHRVFLPQKRPESFREINAALESHFLLAQFLKPSTIGQKKFKALHEEAAALRKLISQEKILEREREKSVSLLQSLIDKMSKPVKIAPCHSEKQSGHLTTVYEKLYQQVQSSHWLPNYVDIHYFNKEGWIQKDKKNQEDLRATISLIAADQKDLYHKAAHQYLNAARKLSHQHKEEQALSQERISEIKEEIDYFIKQAQQAAFASGDEELFRQTLRDTTKMTSEDRRKKIWEAENDERSLRKGKGTTSTLNFWQEKSFYDRLASFYIKHGMEDKLIQLYEKDFIDAFHPQFGFLLQIYVERKEYKKAGKAFQEMLEKDCMLKIALELEKTSIVDPVAFLNLLSPYLGEASRAPVEKWLYSEFIKTLSFSVENREILFDPIDKKKLENYEKERLKFFKDTAAQ